MGIGTSPLHCYSFGLADQGELLGEEDCVVVDAHARDPMAEELDAGDHRRQRRSGVVLVLHDIVEDGWGFVADSSQEPHVPSNVLRGHGFPKVEGHYVKFSWGVLVPCGRFVNVRHP